MSARAAGALLFTCVLLACERGAQPSPGPAATPTGTSTAVASVSPTEAPSAPPTPTSAPPATAPPATPAPDLPPPQVQIERVFPNVTFDMPTNAIPLPGGGWLVTEQAGRIVALATDGSTRTFLDIRDRVSAGGEMGLLGLALAPDFERSGVFWVDYTADGPRRTVISSFASSGGQADAASERIVLEVEQPFANHNGGQIAFGPDGYLYVALGDGGSGGDPRGHGQNVETLLGSILRLDVTDRARYRIPPDNPLVGRVGRDEIWAYGLRNPWRFSFDTATGTLWTADVGQNAWEEVDVVTRGANYGWNVMEGAHCYGASTCDMTGKVLPVFEYSHGDGCSVTGGFVYRGPAIPELRGAYVLGDYCSGTLWGLRYADGRLSAQATIGRVGFSVSSFAQDRAGEVYLLQHAPAGGMYRIVR